jgi:hypothetical protein
MMGHIGYPDPLLMTAHATAIAEIGQISNHVVEQRNFNGRCGFWEVQYIRAMGSITQGDMVTQYFLGVDNLTSGTTGSATKVGAFPTTTNILNGGLMHVDADNGGVAPEGEVSWVIASRADVINFSPFLTTALGANDEISVNMPFHGQQGVEAGFQGVLGLALATVTVGQYLFVLRKGFYPSATVAPGADAAWAAGVGLIAEGGGVLSPYDAAMDPWQSPCAYAIQRKLITDQSTTYPVMMTIQ